MNKLDIVKGFADLAVTIGVSAIVGNAIKLTTDPEAKLLKRVAIGIGGFALSGMIAEAASKYTTDRIDGIAETVSTVLGVKVNSEEVDNTELINYAQTTLPDKENTLKLVENLQAIAKKTPKEGN